MISLAEEEEEEEEEEQEEEEEEEEVEEVEEEFYIKKSNDKENNTFSLVQHFFLRQAKSRYIPRKLRLTAFSLFPIKFSTL